MKGMTLPKIGFSSGVGAARLLAKWPPLLTPGDLRVIGTALRIRL